MLVSLAVSGTAWAAKCAAPSLRAYHGGQPQLTDATGYHTYSATASKHDPAENTISLKESKVRQSIHSILENARWVIRKNGTLEVRPAAAADHFMYMQGRWWKEGQGVRFQASDPLAHPILTTRIDGMLNVDAQNRPLSWQGRFFTRYGTAIGNKSGGVGLLFSLESTVREKLIPGVFGAGQTDLSLVIGGKLKMIKARRQAPSPASNAGASTLDKIFHQADQRLRETKQLINEMAAPRMKGLLEKGWWEFYPHGGILFQVGPHTQKIDGNLTVMQGRWTKGDRGIHFTVEHSPPDPVKGAAVSLPSHWHIAGILSCTGPGRGQYDIQMILDAAGFDGQRHYVHHFIQEVELVQLLKAW